MYFFFKKLPVELTEAEKTEAEIAKLQKAIKEMKSRNAVKNDPGQDMFQKMKSKMIQIYVSLQTYLFAACMTLFHIVTIGGTSVMHQNFQTTTPIKGCIIFTSLLQKYFCTLYKVLLTDILENTLARKHFVKIALFYEEK